MTTDAFNRQATQFRRLALQASTAAGADADTAEDVAQETLLRLWQMRDDPRLYNPEGYATVIARHLTQNELRHKPPLPLDERQAADLMVPSPLDLMLQAEDERWLRYSKRYNNQEGPETDETVITTTSGRIARQIHGRPHHPGGGSRTASVLQHP